MSSIIKNVETLAQSALRADILAIAEAGYAAADLGDAIAKKIHFTDDTLHIVDKAYPLAGRKVFFIGIGKCAVRGGLLIETVLGESLSGGILLDVSPLDEGVSSKMEVYVGTHPLPSEANARASERILELLSGRSETDLVIFLVSGGGSALLSLPQAPMTWADERSLFEALTSRAAPIQDLNIVRKHISKVRGGALAAAAYPAEVISLLVSDVSGDDVSVIASGPTVRDLSTIADAQAVLERYGVDSSSATFLETQKDEKYFTRVTNTLLLASRDALDAMRGAAVARGYAARIVDTHFTGESRDLGRAIIEELHASPPKTALLYAGESTVTLGEGAGKGGRNQEMALATLESIEGGEAVLPFASDGHDNSDHAGAIADEVTGVHMTEKGLSVTEYLDAHRSYDFFTETGDALMTGPTGSNVADLVVALKA